MNEIEITTKRPGVILIAIVLIAGCLPQPVPTEDNIIGKWFFTYVQKALTPFGMNPGPPSFDVIEFKDGGLVHLTDSIRGSSFAGTYTINNGTLHWEFEVPDSQTPVKHSIDCSWTERGKALVLGIPQGEPNADLELEWVYYRQDRLLSDEGLTGKWSVSEDGGKVVMELSADSKYSVNEGYMNGYYRLWQSKHGHALTTSMWIQGEGGFLAHYIYKLNQNTLFLTPLTGRGPEHEKQIKWSRAEEGEVSSINPKEVINTLEEVPVVRQRTKETKPPINVKNVKPDYPEASEKLEKLGIVVLEARITEEGKVKDPKVTRSLAPGFDQAALNAVKQWEFIPASRNGEPVSVTIPLTVIFEPRK